MFSRTIMITCSAFYLLLLEIMIIQQIVSVAGLSDILPEDATLNTTGLATKYGYPPMRYDVVTEDGYILGIYRIPGRERSIPILLIHGLQDSSDTWLLRGQDSLAIALANDGCDVWLANSRGNRYSRRHKSLNPNSDPAFWQFSFHEMGYYDLPAIIDTILNETGAENITAIGHSQGNTMFYVLGSERREYNAKVNVLIALAPIAYMDHAAAPTSILIKFSPMLDELAKTRDPDEVFGDSSSDSKLLHKLCHIPITGYLVCANKILFPLMGFDPAELEPKFFPITAAHFPAGSSSLSALHFLQVGYKKIFAQYDHGSEINMKVYNSSEPRLYHLDQVTMPIALLAGRNDRLSAIPDVMNLREQLPNVVYYLENPRSLMNHMNYVWGRNMRDYLFPYIYHVLRENNHYFTKIEPTEQNQTQTINNSKRERFLVTLLDRLRSVR